MSDEKSRHVHAPRRRRAAALALALLAVLLPLLFGVGAGAAHADVSPYGRSLAVAGLADPDIYKVDDNLYFLSGTSSEDFLPIYTSTDLLTFTLLNRYDPDAFDPDHRYCREWAPELTRQGNQYVLYFVASRVDEDSSCPSNDSQQTIFYATAPDANMQFGAPQEINEDTTHPRTYETKDCPTDGCENAMRLDPSVYSDGARLWMHYTWFDPTAGTVVSAFPLDAPDEVFEVTRPTRKAEQKINEAPTLFSRDGRQYLFYSQGNMRGDYGMQYFMGASVGELTREQAKYSFSSPLEADDGRLIENQGHNTVTDRAGQFYTLYHVARFTADGVYAGRDVYVQPLMFKADGTLNTLNTVTLRWIETAGSTYSLDVQTRDGVWISGCMNPGSEASVTFNEVCTGADDQVVHKADVAAFRIIRIADDQPVGATTLAYDGYTDTLDATV
jgi:beta-xylosidase